MFTVQQIRYKLHGTGESAGAKSTTSPDDLITNLPAGNNWPMAIFKCHLSELLVYRRWQMSDRYAVL